MQTLTVSAWGPSTPIYSVILGFRLGVSGVKWTRAFLSGTVGHAGDMCMLHILLPRSSRVDILPSTYMPLDIWRLRGGIFWDVRIYGGM